MYTIATEPANRLVRITISGMLTVEQVASLYREEHAAIREMACPLGQQVVLVDLRKCPLQFQEVVKTFKDKIGGEHSARRIALVTGDSAARMQARRIIERDGAALFATLAEAETWLLDATGSRAAA
jgi:hypothetical protein